MKLIDKYLLKSLLVPLMHCILAFTLLYVIFDLFDNLSDFVEGGTPFLQVVRYYAVLMPTALVHLVPISLLLSVLYSLSSLTKNNELTAMRATGISLFRLIVPYIFVGLVASVAVGIVNESISPGAAYWCEKFVNEQGRRNKDSVHVTKLAFKQESENRTWFVNEFDTRNYDMKGVEFIQYREDMRSEEKKISAKEAKWLDGYWIFTDVVEQRYDEFGNPRGAPSTYLSREMTGLTEVPEDFMSWVKPPEFMSSLELLRYIDVNTRMKKEAIARKKVDLHYRLAQPWTCLIVTLLGIPFGTHTGRKGALAGIILSISLFFAYYALINFGLFAGKSTLIPAWIAGWFPNLLFGTTGIILIYRMR